MLHTPTTDTTTTASAPVADPREAFARAQGQAWEIAARMVAHADALSVKRQGAEPWLTDIEQALRCARLALDIATGGLR